MSSSTSHSPPSAATLRAPFDRASEFTIGLEEELMLLDPETLAPVPRAPEVLGRFDGDDRFKLELPASQLELVTRPQVSVRDAAAELLDARRALIERTGGPVVPAGAGVSPLGSGRGALNALPRYQPMIREFGPIAERQLVCALQVHISVSGSDRALAVYNHVRTYLPWLAALAANGAFYEGGDSGLASVRPKLSELLPRQGIPPAFEDWERYAQALRWGDRAGVLAHPGAWWWELRPHPVFGTLEFRVADSQATVAEAAAVTALIHTLVVWIAHRYDAGESLPVADTWRLEENRWSACRHGVEGDMLDPITGRRRATRECLHDLLETLSAIAAELGASAALDQAAAMIEVNGAIAQRQSATAGGARAVAAMLVERFLEPWSG